MEKVKATLDAKTKELEEERDRNQIREDDLERENRILRLKVQTIESNLLKLKQTIINGNTIDN